MAVGESVTFSFTNALCVAAGQYIHIDYTTYPPGGGNPAFGGLGEVEGLVPPGSCTHPASTTTTTKKTPSWVKRAQDAKLTSTGSE